MNGAPAFGGSQSFPPTAPNSSFGFTPPQASSFTFGVSAASNPFSNIGNSANNSTDNNQGNNGVNNPSAAKFGGMFGSTSNGNFNAQADGDTMMESPKKTFGSGFSIGNAPAPSKATFSFGQSLQAGVPSATSQTANPFPNFGQSQPAAQASNVFSGFGSQNASELKPQTSLFGQPVATSQPVANPFGSVTTNPTPSFPGSLHRQPLSATDTSNNSFGQQPQISSSNPSDPILKMSAPTETSSSNVFGKQLTASSATGNLFGQAAPAVQPSSAGGPFGSLFGQRSVTPEPPQPQSSTSQAPFSFSAFPASNPLASTTMFGSQFAGPTSKSAALGGSAVSSNIGEVKANGFDFTSSTSSSQTAPGLHSAGTVSTTTPSQANNATGGALFGSLTRQQESAHEVTEPATSENSSFVQQPATTQGGTSISGGGLFGRKSEFQHTFQPGAELPKPREPEQSTSPTKEPSASLFNTFQPRTSTQAPALPSNSSFGKLFSAPSSADSSVKEHGKTQVPNDFGGIPRMGVPITSSGDDSASAVEALTKKASDPVSESTPTSSVFFSASNVTPAASNTFSALSEDPTAFAPFSKIKMRSHGSSTTPDFFEGNERIEHDRISRIRNLNTNFQKAIARLDPAAQDFEVIVRHFAAQRESIGASLGLYQRNKAGMKRKVDNSNASEEVQNGSKRARTDSSSRELANVEKSQSIDKGEASASTSRQASETSSLQSTVQPGHNRSESSSSTSSMFKNMMATSTPAPIASSSAVSTPSKPISSFAGFDNSSSLAERVDTALTATLPKATESTEKVNPFASLNAFTAKNSEPAIDSSNTSLFKAPMPSTTPTKSPPKKPAFEVPKFGGGSGISFMDSFAKQSAKSAAEMEAEVKRKRKAEDFDSDEDDEAEWERQYEEEQRAKRNKLAFAKSSGVSGFQPTVGGMNGSSTAKNFFNLANDNSARKDSMSDKITPSNNQSGRPVLDAVTGIGKSIEQPVNISDEEDESARDSDELVSQREETEQGSGEDGERDEYYEEGESDAVNEIDEDQAEENEEELQDEEESDDEDIQAAMSRSRFNASKAPKDYKGSLFERVERNPDLNPDGTPKSESQNSGEKEVNGILSNPPQAKITSNGLKATSGANKSFKAFAPSGILNASTFASTPNAPEFSPFTPVNGTKASSDDPFAPAGSVFTSSQKAEFKGASNSEKTNGSSFLFTPKPTSTAASPHQSVLFGGNASLGPSSVPGEGLFGSRPSTPNNGSSSNGGVFGNLGTTPNFTASQGDNTWKAGTPIKFNSPDKDGPTVNVTAATPPAKEDPSTTQKSFGSLFGASSSKAGSNSLGNVGFGFGGPTALTASPLLAPSVLSSAVSSRATSPGATDTESVNTDTGDDHSDDPQSNLMSSRPGEEKEEVLFEGRSKALRLSPEKEERGKTVPAGWTTQGVGQLRVLKHEETGKTRILLRAEPNSNIVINTSLNPAMTYKSAPTKGSGSVRFGIPTSTGIEQWVIKVKTAAVAEQLADILEAKKGEGIGN